MNTKLILFLVISIPFFAKAQMSAGLKAGTSVSTIISNNNGLINNFRTKKRTVKFGAYYNYKIEKKKIALQSELLFTNYAYNKGVESNIGIISLHLQYIEVPIHFGYYIAPQLFASTGAKVSILTSTDNILKEDIQEVLFAPINYGVLFNITYSFAPSFKVNIRYDYNFANIIKSYESTSILQNSISARTSMISICFSIGFTQGEHNDENVESGDI